MLIILQLQRCTNFFQYLCILLFVFCFSCAQATTPITDESLLQLGNQFQKTRKPSQTRSDDLLWQGKKHQLMQQIAQQLDLQFFNCSSIESLLGTADTQVAIQSLGEVNWTSQSPNQQQYQQSKLLAYYWRQQHDMLIVACSEQQTALTGWRYLWE
ncbi:hypothetical protein [Pelagibaculum spongiae]|uniref:Uncharacterized protein n=1 Tax=Pelagibaculum spongiae TaxID=2080658 RepID=A0A2V1H4D6_9GAMM|nr:hypothetical protein [Pelagibaculum spongiae]PVZ72088.1 hypothetical protein DC094_03455 [Pelagibaculum spongiae]